MLAVDALISQTASPDSKKKSGVHAPTVPRVAPGPPHPPILETRVTGEPRKEQIRIPAHLRGYQPGVEANQKNIALELPIHRQLHTVSMSQSGKKCIAVF